MRLKYYTAILFFSLLYTNLRAQVIEVFPKIPETSSLIKNIELPPGTYTGIFGHQIDLIQIKLGDFIFPITLNYSTAGIKVNSASGNVGMGWILNVGNISLTREVRGSNDLTTNELQLSKKYSEFSPNEDFPLIADSQSDYFKAKQLIGVTQANNDGSPSIDAERDYFIYSLINNSGRFIKDSNNKFHTIPKDDVKIINENNLVDNRGIKYFFSEYPSMENNTISLELNEPQISPTPTSYSIKIDSLQIPKGGIIRFNYESDIYTFTSSYDESVKLKTHNTSLFNCTDFSGVINKSRGKSTVREKLISNITFPQGKIIFIYINENEEVFNKKILKKIQLLDLNNKVIKEFEFNNTFIDSDTSSAIIPISDSENFNKRLFLSSIKETLNSSTYKFDYYGVDWNSKKTNLPAKFSGKEDFWGNYKASGGFIPSANTLYINNLGRLVEYKGANKNPVLEDVKIGSISNIYFPTGGNQKILYSLDDIYDENNYENIKTNKYNRISATFTEITNSISKSFTIPIFNNMLEPYLNFYYEGINEIDYGENNLPTKDHYYIEVYKNNILWKHIYNSQNHYFNHNELKAGDVIKIKFNHVRSGIHNSNTLSSDAFVNFSFIDVEKIVNPKNVNTGNLRVEQIILQNTPQDILIKQYIYKDSINNNKSSGIFLGRMMNRDYYTYASVNDSNGYLNEDKNTFCEYLSLSSQNNFNLYSIESKTVVYKSVIEKNINPQDNSFYFIRNKYKTPYSTSFSHYDIPYISGPYYGFLGGLLESQEFLDNNNFKYKEIINSYKFDNYFNQFSSKYESNFPQYLYPALHISIRNNYYIKDPFGDIFNLGLDYSRAYVFNTNNYFYPNTWIKKISTTTIENYKNLSPIINNVVYNYSNSYNHISPIKEINTNSKAETITTEYKYPADLASNTNSIWDKMVERNMIATPVETKVSNNTTVLSEQRTKFNYYPGTNNTQLILPQYVYTKKGAMGTDVNNEDRKITYNRYDDKGNLTQYTVENGIPVSIIWGYNGQYPIAKIEGASFDLVSSFENDLKTASNSNSLTKTSFDALRNAFPNALVTGYIYKPLVGVTMIIQPNGIAEHYKYDTANRLEEIKNDQGEVLKKFEYNYAQPQ